MLEIEKLGLTEMDSREIKEVDGGQGGELGYWFSRSLSFCAGIVAGLSAGGSPSTSCYTNGSYMYF